MTTPATGSVLERWSPVVFEVHAPVGYDVTILVRLGGESGLWSVAMAEGLVPVNAPNTASSPSPFSPMYRNRSSVVVIDNGASGRDLTVSLIPNSGWSRRDITVAYFVNTEPTVDASISAGSGGLMYELPFELGAPGLPTDPTEARRCPLVLEFDVPAGSAASVLIIMGDGSAHWMAAYCEALGGFSPLFNKRSTVEITGTSPRHFVMSIIPNAFWAQVIDDIAVLPIAGIELEP